MIPHRNYFEKKFSAHNIKMSNISPNNGIESINKEVGLLQDRLKITKKV